MAQSVLYVGAPVYNGTSTDDPALTINNFIPTFRKFFGELEDKTVTEAELEYPTAKESGSILPDIPAWRVLPCVHEHLSTGFSQQAWLQSIDVDAEPKFWTPRLPLSKWRSFENIDGTALNSPNPSTLKQDNLDEQDGADDGMTSQFLEHSLLLHDATQSFSFSTNYDPTQVSDSVSDCDPSLDKDSDYISQSITASSVPKSLPPQPPRALHLLDSLSFLPSASHILSIQPQLITYDLIVGIISISNARRITTRRTGQELDVIELLCGDETRAGFMISFWLKLDENGEDTSQDEHTSKPENMQRQASKTDKQRKRKDEAMRAKLSALRPADIVLLRTVAIGQFRGRVHGQSFNNSAWGRDIATEIVLLYRAGLHRDGRTHQRMEKRKTHSRNRRSVDSTIIAEQERVKAEIDTVYDSDDLSALSSTSDRNVNLKNDAILSKLAKVRQWTRRFICPPFDAAVNTSASDTSSLEDSADEHPVNKHTAPRNNNKSHEIKHKHNVTDKHTKASLVTKRQADDWLTTIERKKRNLDRTLPPDDTPAE